MEEQIVNVADNAEPKAEQTVQETQAPASSAEAPAAEEAASTEVNAAEEQQNEDPFLKYIRQAFSKEHIDEFMQKLTDDQKSFVYVFCSGFETAIGRHIVGVYDTDYINGYHFTKEVLDSLRIIVKPVDVKDTDLKFTIVAQLV